MIYFLAHDYRYKLNFGIKTGNQRIYTPLPFVEEFPDAASLEDRVDEMGYPGLYQEYGGSGYVNLTNIDSDILTINSNVQLSDDLWGKTLVVRKPNTYTLTIPTGVPGTRAVDIELWENGSTVIITAPNALINGAANDWRIVQPFSGARLRRTGYNQYVLIGAAEEIVP